EGCLPGKIIIRNLNALSEAKAPDDSRVPRDGEAGSAADAGETPQNDPCRRSESGGVHQLWNSCVSLERTLAGFLRGMGESLLVLSGQFHDTEEISGRSERISDYQGDRSLLAR